MTDPFQPGRRAPSDSPTSSWGGAFGFTALGQVVQGIVRLGFLVLVGRYAGKELLGEVSAVLAVCTLLVLAWPQPAGAVTARYMSLATGGSAEQRSIETFTSRTVLLSAAPLALAAGSISLVWFGPRSPLVIWATLLPVCMGAATYVRGARNGRLQFRQGLVWESVGAVVTLSIMLGIIWAGLPEHALAALCAGYLVSAVPGWPRARVRTRGDLPPGLVRYTTWTSLQVIAAGGLIHVVVALAAIYATPEELGDMGAAISIATPALLLSIALRTSAMPFVTRLIARGDIDGARRATDLLMRGMVVVFIPVFGVACIWADELMVILYSDGFSGDAELLVILLLGVSLNSFNASHVWLMSGPVRGARALALSNSAGFTVGLIMALVGSSAAATNWAALGYLAGSAVSSGSAILVVWRRGGMPWSPVVARLTVGYALIGASLFAAHDTGWPTTIAVTLVFLSVNVCMSGPDVRRISQAHLLLLRQAR